MKAEREKKIKSEIGVHFEVLESEVQGENEVESVGEEKDSDIFSVLRTLRVIFRSVMKGIRKESIKIKEPFNNNEI